MSLDSTVIETPQAELKALVICAKEQALSWGPLSIKKRLEYVAVLLEKLDQSKTLIVNTLSAEIGKPVSEALMEFEITRDWTSWNLLNAEKILAAQQTEVFSESEIILEREPWGVAAVIVPWNYPLQNVFLGVLQLLLAGNTAVIKHSEECVLTCKILEDLFSNTFPEGVISFVYGGAEVGRNLINQEIDFISFTGSTKVGQEIYTKASEKFIPAVLEMGGSSPGIIFKDANLDLACSHAFTERFANCGQVCCALKRLIVHESVYDKVLSKLKNHLENLIIGDPLDEKTTLGPLVSQKQLSLLHTQVEDAVQLKANVISYKKVINLSGNFYRPCLIENVTSEMRVMQEEVFGPVLPIIKFKHEEEAIEIANDSSYGLSAFIYTENIDLAKRVSRLIKAGQISINGASYFANGVPFGGYKKSGLGRTDGIEGYRTATQIKVIAN